MKDLLNRLNSINIQYDNTPSNQSKRKHSLEIQRKFLISSMYNIFKRVESLFTESFILEVVYTVENSSGLTKYQVKLPNISKKDFIDYVNLYNAFGLSHIKILEIKENREMIKILPL